MLKGGNVNKLMNVFNSNESNPSHRTPKPSSYNDKHSTEANLHEF